MDVEHPPVVLLGVVRQDAAVWAQQSSGDSRYLRINSATKFRSESGVVRWSATLTCSGPKGLTTTGRHRRDGAADVQPPDHCMGERTAKRPSMPRFSPLPISAP